MPEWQAITTTSAPAALTFGTQIFAVSTMPGKVILPATFALSQIAMPGLVRPTMPTLSAGPALPSFTLRIT